MHGSLDAGGFLRVGERCARDVEAALRKVGKDFASFGDVLDFGCGCGRTLLWFSDRPPRLHGTDIDAEAISWCRTNLRFADSFAVNGRLPPLDYPSETFDLVYAVSVFTHLNEEYQFRWLEELKRVTRPGGIVLLTLHGRYFWKDLSPVDAADVERDGFKFVASNDMRGILPEWYQNAFHTEGYVRARFSEHFDVLDYAPRGMDRRQDVVILQKPPGGATSARDTV